MRNTLFGSVLLATVVTVGSARAEDPMGIVVAPRSVELLPSPDAATGIVIHGTVALYDNASHGAPEYFEPYCGYLYFECAPGKLEACRTQWAEIAASVGKPTCRGFLRPSSHPDVIIRNEGTPLMSPDVYDPSAPTEAITTFGKCAAQRAAKCTPPPPAAPGSPGSDAGTTTSDGGVTHADGGGPTGGGPGGTSLDAGGAASGDDPTGSTDEKGSLRCAARMASAGPTGADLFLFAAAAAAIRRRIRV